MNSANLCSLGEEKEKKKSQTKTYQTGRVKGVGGERNRWQEQQDQVGVN